MLTQRQRDLLGFIDQRIRQDGVSPSYKEMQMALGLKSSTGAHQLIEALVERGFLRRLPHRARALEVLKMPGRSDEDAARPAGPGSAEFERPWVAGSTSEVVIPVMGRIAAGLPAEAISHRETDIAVPTHLTEGPGEHFALKVTGDSMIGVGIHDNDTVIIRRRRSADNGDIVVALVQGEEATLKRFRRTDDGIALESANPAFPTREYPDEEVEVQGKLVGLMRSY